jgi:hypothetical protein
MACIQAYSTSITDADIGLTDKTIIFTTTTAITIPQFGSGNKACTREGYRSIVQNIGAITTSNHTNGIITESAADTVISNLGICMPSQSTPFVFNINRISACDSSDSAFITTVESEYKYYYALYMHSMSQLIATLNGNTPSGWSSSSNATNAYMRVATVLNTHVNDIIFIINRIAQKWRSTSTPALITQLNSLETGPDSLQVQSKELTYQRGLLASGDTMLLMKEMEQYSRQKAKYHNNMLMWYSFLNITALGLLFYVYRSG